MRQNFDFLGHSVATYNDHIEVKSVFLDVMSAADNPAADKPAADNEMAMKDILQWCGKDILQWCGP